VAHECGAANRGGKPAFGPASFVAHALACCVEIHLDISSEPRLSRSGTQMPLVRGLFNVADAFKIGSARATRSSYAQLNPDLAIGNDRNRFPLAAKIALQIAGGVGGSAGSPNPVGLKVVFRKCTSISGT